MSDIKKMNYINMEATVEQFIDYIKLAPLAYQQVNDKFINCNNVLYDLCHAAELNPNYLLGIDVVKMLRLNQIERRTYKESQRILKGFADWAKKHAKAIEELNTVLANAKQINKENDVCSYTWKTDALGKNGTKLVRGTAVAHKKLSAMPEYYLVQEFIAPAPEEVVEDPYVDTLF